MALSHSRFTVISDTPSTSAVSSALRPLDLVGQLDEQRLAAVCAGVNDATTAARIAERILDVAQRPIGPGGLPVVPSIGATCGAAGQRRPAALLQAALQIADEVSDRGGNHFAVV